MDSVCHGERRGAAMRDYRRRGVSGLALAAVLIAAAGCSSGGAHGSRGPVATGWAPTVSAMERAALEAAGIDPIEAECRFSAEGYEADAGAAGLRAGAAREAVAALAEIAARRRAAVSLVVRAQAERTAALARLDVERASAVTAEVGARSAALRVQAEGEAAYQEAVGRAEGARSRSEAIAHHAAVDLAARVREWRGEAGVLREAGATDAAAERESWAAVEAAEREGASEADFADGSGAARQARLAAESARVACESLVTRMLAEAAVARDLAVADGTARRAEVEARARRAFGEGRAELHTADGLEETVRAEFESVVASALAERAKAYAAARLAGREAMPVDAAWMGREGRVAPVVALMDPSAGE